MLNYKKYPAAWAACLLAVFSLSAYSIRSAYIISKSTPATITPVYSDFDESQVPSLSHRLVMPEKAKIVKYTVKSGDTVESISKAYSVNVSTIAESNGISKDSSLKEGQTLTFSSVDGIVYKVKDGETLWDISQAYSIELASITSASGINPSDTLSIGQELIIPGADKLKAVKTNNDVKSSGTVKVASRSSLMGILPVKGHLTSGYGRREDGFHKGIDLCAPTGSSVYASMDGKVTFSGWDNGGYGYLIIINHGNGYQTYYGHNSKLLVKAGQSVSKGQVIAAVGMTGDASAPHCHFEVRKNGTPVNPLSYVR
jgi:Membrane proteins related to metalloendopeptidases